MKKTLVLGASPNPSRYSFLAVKKLLAHGHEVVPVGTRRGEISGLEILHGNPEVAGIHTVTMYVNPSRQEVYYDYLLSLRPERIIFNPGTENPFFMKKAREAGVETLAECTLVMLAFGAF